MPGDTAHKKRKRDEVNEEDASLTSTIHILEQNHAAVGPVLANFPGVQPSKTTGFKCYALKEDRRGGDEADFASRYTHIAGETDTVEFYSTSEAGKTVGCSYLIGVRNKRTNVITLRAAPFHPLARRVKALKNIVSTSQATPSERLAAREDLGETFGTRKAQAAMRAAQRNKVDISAMKGVTGHIQETIQANTTSLPTEAQAKETFETNLKIPPHNMEATTPEDAYPLLEIIPEREFNDIAVDRLMSATTDVDRKSCLPFSRSTWLMHHLEKAFEGSKPNKKTLRVLMYISILFAFRTFVRHLDADYDGTIRKRLPGVSSQIISGLLARFTESTRGSNIPRATTDAEARLLSYLFALILHVDQFSTDTALIASDLAMPVTIVNIHFKLLGCKIDKPTINEMNRLGLPASAAGTKRASLRVPLNLPKPRTKSSKW